MFRLQRPMLSVCRTTRMEMPAHLAEMIERPLRQRDLISRTLERNERMERERKRRLALEKIDKTREAARAKVIERERRIAREMIEKAREAVRTEFMRHPYRTRRMLELFSKVCGVDRKTLKSETRVPKVAQARMCAMWMLRQQTGLSLPRIGARFGNRDHSTVLHGIRRVEASPELLEQARMWQREVLKLERQLYGNEV